MEYATVYDKNKYHVENLGTVEQIDSILFELSVRLDKRVRELNTVLVDRLLSFEIEFKTFWKEIQN